MMATKMFSCIVYLMAISLETAVANCQSGNVSLSSSKAMICPSLPVTVQCNVTKPQNDVHFFLSWECTGPGGMKTERLVLCDTGPVADLSCKFGDVYDVKGSCTCNETLIISEATFNTTSMCDMVLYCSNGGAEKQQVAASVKGLNPPTLSMNYTVVMMDNENYEVTVWWRAGDCTPDDVEYVVSLTNTSSEEIDNFTTNLTEITQILQKKTEYKVTVKAQHCDRTITSTASNKLFIYIPELPATGTPVTIMSSMPTEADNAGAIAGGMVSAVVFVLFVLLCLGFIYYWNKRRNIHSLCQRITLLEEVDVSGNIVDVDYPAEDLTPEEKEEFTKQTEDDKEKRERTGVGALCVSEGFIYYSSEEEGSDMLIYTIRKCKIDGELVFFIPGFSHVRGIGKDTDGCFYVGDSLRSRVLKFEKNWNPVRKTSNKCADLRYSFGLLVDVDYIFVCSNRNKHICVMNHDLKVCYKILLSFNPTDITKFDEKFFVTTKSAIIMIYDIDFKMKTFKSHKFYTLKRNGSKPMSFKPNCELRGICASDKYLYVTEKETSGRLLCLQFQNNELHYIDAIENCSPNAIAYGDDSVYYSQGVYGGKFSISKATFKETTPFDA